jgi:hypothetical protein
VICNNRAYTREWALLKSIFERIGGDQMISEVIDEFYDRVLADPDLKPFFRNTSMDKLRRMQREFFSAALDGPITYSGKPLSHVHHGRGITISAQRLDPIGTVYETTFCIDIDYQNKHWPGHSQ